MLFKTIIRYFHIRPSCWAAEKSQLATLRKKTGYTFSNCKKALELHKNDLTEAEKWLHKQAQTLGWSKATKLEGRETSQGLVAVTIRDQNAALVEINCETDFVARNKTFQEMLTIAAQACIQFMEKQPHTNNPLTKIGLDTNQLKQLQTPEGKSLADQLALMIGTVGENAMLRRAMCLKADSGIHLSAYAHPSGTEQNNVLLGRFAGLIALKQKDQNVDIQELGKNLCQHVVGMAPKKVGTSDDEPAKNPDEEVCLIHQEYLIDNLSTVKDVLEENQVEVVDFKRFECGEDLVVGVQPLTEVQTCQ